jgi:hypothetical protein
MAKLLGAPKVSRAYQAGHDLEPSVSKVVNREKFKVTPNLLFGPSSLDFFH